MVMCNWPTVQQPVLSMNGCFERSSKETAGNIMHLQPHCTAWCLLLRVLCCARAQPLEPCRGLLLGGALRAAAGSCISLPVCLLGSQ